VNVYYDSGLQWLNKQQTIVYAAVLGGRSLYETERAKTGVLVIGNESKGIQPIILEKATQRLTIPKRGDAESLNAAVATGIILSHLLD
jgi:TrmH family RNA methyltransferase